jgi:hypothetical protein
LDAFIFSAHTGQTQGLSTMLGETAWDRCYDFKNIFSEKNCKNIGVFDSK